MIVLLTEISCICVPTVRLPSSLAVYPLDKKRGGVDITGRNPSATFGKVSYGEGPDGRKSGSTQLSGQPKSYVEIPNSGKLDARYYISVLIYVYSEKQTGTILNYNPDRKGFEVSIIGQRKLQVGILERTRKTTITVSTTKPVIEDKIWNYVGVTYGRKTLTIWVNSKVVASKVIGKVQLDTGRPIRLGSYRGSRNYFRGRLFCLQVYSVELSGRQIEEARKRCFLEGKMKLFLYSIVAFTH